MQALHGSCLFPQHTGKHSTTRKCTVLGVLGYGQSSSSHLGSYRNAREGTAGEADSQRGLPLPHTRPHTEGLRTKTDGENDLLSPTIDGVRVMDGIPVRRCGSVNCTTSTQTSLGTTNGTQRKGQENPNYSFSLLHLAAGSHLSPAPRWYALR